MFTQKQLVQLGFNEVINLLKIQRDAALKMPDSLQMNKTAALFFKFQIERIYEEAIDDINTTIEDSQTWEI